MKNIILLLAMFLVSALIFAQDGWTELPNAPKSNLRFNDVFFITDDIGWVVSQTGLVFKTTDGGDSWQEQFDANSSLRNIEFLTEDIGFLGTLGNVFYKTLDGGATWNPVSISPNPEAICGLHAVENSTTIYGCGAYFTPAYIIKSVDSGENWQFIDMSAYSDGLVEVLFTDEDHGFASGNGFTGGIILETFDGGSTWTEIFNSGVSGDYVWKLQVMENNTVIFGSIQSNVQGKLVKSLDSGVTWTMKDFPDNGVQAVGFVNPTHGWMGGFNTGFYKTEDGGDTWVNLGLGSDLNRFIFRNNDLAYCSGNSIYKHDGTPLGIENFEQDVVPDIEITIAPNPIIDQLHIEIAYQHIDNLLLGLYHLDGKLIKKLIRDRVERAGKKSYTFDFDYPAGTYLLDFHTNNGRRSKIVVKE